MKEINPSEFLRINETEPIKQEFDRIAKILFNKVDIMINDRFFSLYDIEFYYFAPSHQDGYAFPHTKPIGAMRMHDYGIDISLGYNGQDTYGGILIRGAWISSPDKSKEFLTKSQFEIELFNSFKLGPNEITFAKRENIEEFKPIMTIRKHLGKIEPGINKTLEMFEAKYRFLVNDPSVFAKIKGKEEILRNSTLDRKEWQPLLNYKIKN